MSGLSQPVSAPAPDVQLSFCGRCGEPADAPHPDCERALQLAPPRYCGKCRRRMVVKVLPTGWSATCSRHGDVVSG